MTCGGVLPADAIRRLKPRLQQHGAELIEPLPATPFGRSFFREPVNGYVEVIDQDRLDNWRRAAVRV